MPPGTSRNAPTLTVTPKTTGRGKKETLHYLAASSSTTAVDAARALLEKGANPRVVDKDGLTPLHYACAHDNVAMAQLLLTFGCDPMSTDKLGRTALSVAKGNTLRFLRRYQKKDKHQRLGLFRRFFACHTPFGNNSTFFITRQTAALPAPPPTQLADANSVSFNRGNVLTKSYRNAKKKIRQTFHVFQGRSRSNSVAQLEDVVMTSEGIRTVRTPSRVVTIPKSTPKRSMSTSDLFRQVPDRRKIEEEDQRVAKKKKDNGPTVLTPSTTRRVRTGRSRTPDALGRGTVAAKVGRQKRSQSQDRNLEGKFIKAPVQSNPMSYYNTDKARQAGLRPRPSAPPLTPESDEEKDMTRKSGGLNSTGYITANEDWSNLASDFEKLDINKTPKARRKKDEREEEDPTTPSLQELFDDGEIRKIRRMREVELRTELKKFGISPAGPLDARNRRMFEKKLLLERKKVVKRGYSPDLDVGTMKYSPQLELVLKSGLLPKDFASRVRKYDENVREEFSGNGFGYTAFCYLIMDPRKLGDDVDSLTFSRFVEAIFYVGKGTKNRPLAHFIDTRNERRANNVEKLKSNPKMQLIDELWKLGHGVPRHEIAHGISDEEAFVREASLIEAIRLVNLSNKKGGEFHGSTRNWDSVTRAEYGVFLLNGALSTLKAEGIRLIREENLPENIYPFVNNRRGTPKTPK